MWKTILLGLAIYVAVCIAWPFVIGWWAKKTNAHGSGLIGLALLPALPVIVAFVTMRDEYAKWQDRRARQDSNPQS